MYTSIVFTLLVALAAAVPQGPIQSCTTTFTSPAPAFGCKTTVSKHTVTSSVDCHGCTPTTVTAGIQMGPGPVCVGGRKTVTAAGTTMPLACSASPNLPDPGIPTSTEYSNMLGSLGEQDLRPHISAYTLPVGEFRLYGTASYELVSQGLAVSTAPCGSLALMVALTYGTKVCGNSILHKVFMTRLNPHESMS
nr:hypothetical protein CFP56_30884 [Quercus suber]